MKKTAVEWLVEQLKERGYAGDFPPHLLFEQAKEMEKQQHSDTWNDGMKSDNGFFGDFEQYYRETYKQQEQ